MSPQQVTFAVCVSAVALVSLVAGQAVDPQACTEGARKSMDNFRSDIQKTMGELLSQASKHGQDAANIDAMTAQVNEITGNLSNIANSDNFTDAGKMTKAVQQSLSSYMKLITLAIRSESLTSGINMYASFAGKSIPMYANFVNNLINACAPTAGSSH